MKTMSDYGLYCTEAQTKKALELGAPIVHHENACTTNSTPHFYIGERGNYQKGYILYIIPTAEEMMGWLEEQGVSVEITMASQNIGYYSLKRIDTKGAFDFTGRCEETYSSRKEATLAAIDEALRYLINNKK